MSEAESFNEDLRFGNFLREQAEEYGELCIDDVDDIAESEKDTPETQYANVLLQDGEALEFLENTYKSLHCGDLESLHAVIYSSCLQSSLTSRGLHPTITGSKGSGKSSGILSALHLVDQERVRSGSMSPKAALFLKVPEKTIFYLDDIEYNPEFTSLAKRAMTNFQRITTHTTVTGSGGKNSKMVAVTVSLNPRCVFITTSVSPMGDDQLLDRQIVVAGSCANDSYLRWEQERRLTGRAELPVTFEVKVCREIMKNISQQNFIVKHHRRITFSFSNDRRLVNQLYDIVEASAILDYMRRPHTRDSDGTIHLETQDGDLEHALLFDMFHVAREENEGRLTPAEQRLDTMIMQSMASSLDRMVYSEYDIALIYGKSVQAVRKLLFGNKGRAGEIHGGLCEKTKWYIPDMDALTHKNIIRVERHQTGFPGVFASWI